MYDGFPSLDDRRFHGQTLRTSPSNRTLLHLTGRLILEERRQALLPVQYLHRFQPRHLHRRRRRRRLKHRSNLGRVPIGREQSRR